MLTRERFERFKADYNVYGHTTVRDKYGGAQRAISSEPKAVIHVMWRPLADEASVVLYGDKVSKMLEAVLYDDADVREFDIVRIGDTDYEVRSILPYNTHRLIRVEKI